MVPAQKMCDYQDKCKDLGYMILLCIELHTKSTDRADRGLVKPFTNKYSCALGMVDTKLHLYASREACSILHLRLLCAASSSALCSLFLYRGTVLTLHHDNPSALPAPTCPSTSNAAARSAKVRTYIA